MGVCMSSPCCKGNREPSIGSGGSGGVGAGLYGVPQVASRIIKRDLNCHSLDEDGLLTLPPFTLQPDEMIDGKTYYGVRIVNGSMINAGTRDNGVFIILVGDKVSTGRLKLLDGLGSLEGIESSTHYDFLVESEASLEDLQVVVLGNDGRGMAVLASWYVDFTMTYRLADQSDKRFPCSHWIGKDDMVSTTSEAKLLNDLKDNFVLRRERADQIDKRRLQYKWLLFPGSGIPSGIDESVLNLPADEQFSVVKAYDFGRAGLKAITDLGLRGVVLTVDSLYDYISLAKSLDEQDVSLYEGSRWVSDVEFGRQMLNGVNPVVIRRCTNSIEKFKLPKNFPVTNEMVQPFFTRRKNRDGTISIEKPTLEEEMNAGRIYICDMKLMDGLPPRETCFSPAPICLLYVNSSDQLVPIAIQLKQGLRDEEKDEPNPIFLPSDHWIDWLLAKIYYQSAHSQFHQISTHYFCCHAAMEAYGMGTMRNLPDAHPINKLLIPHFRYTMAINAAARVTLINKGGIIDQAFGIGGKGKEELFRRVSKAYHVDWTNIEHSVRERGVDDADQLPGYYYRDDGIKVWRALKTFVTDVVKKFYSSDTEVSNDKELSDWSYDLYSNGFPGYFGAEQGHGFPERITSIDSLIKECTRIIFTGSAQHASINFGQYFIYGYVPNAPFAVRRPPPVKKGITNYKMFLDSIPDKTSALLGMVLAYVLSQYSKDEIYLGNYPAQRFTEKEIERYIERARLSLEGISGEIKVRNEDLDMPYTFMLPDKTPNSITI